jgi:hypothetical protein
VAEVASEVAVPGEPEVSEAASADSESIRKPMFVRERPCSVYPRRTRNVRILPLRWALRGGVLAGMIERPGGRRELALPVTMPGHPPPGWEIPPPASCSPGGLEPPEQTTGTTPPAGFSKRFAVSGRRVAYSLPKKSSAIETPRRLTGAEPACVVRGSSPDGGTPG